MSYAILDVLTNEYLYEITNTSIRSTVEISELLETQEYIRFNTEIIPTVNNLLTYNYLFIPNKLSILTEAYTEILVAFGARQDKYKEICNMDAHRDVHYGNNLYTVNRYSDIINGIDPPYEGISAKFSPPIFSAPSEKQLKLELHKLFQKYLLYRNCELMKVLYEYNCSNLEIVKL